MADAYRDVHVIINPASGKDEPILNVINRVLQQYDTPWKAHVTHAAGDATTLTKTAIDNGADLIICYGGDGTLMEIINGMIDCDVPLAVLPGGTGNSVARGLGLPESLADALEVAVTSRTFRRLDLGRIEDRYFVLRAYTGIDQEQVASREMKDKYGLLAYPVSAFQFLRDAPEADYSVRIDGEEIAERATLCYIDNMGSMSGVRPFELFKPPRSDQADSSEQADRAMTVEPWDGLLDVFLIGAAGNELVAVTSYLLDIGDAQRHVSYLQGKHIRIEASPPQPVWIDGEIYGETPITIEVAPAVVKIVLPPDSDPAP